MISVGSDAVGGGVRESGEDKRIARLCLTAPVIQQEYVMLSDNQQRLSKLRGTENKLFIHDRRLKQINCKADTT